MFLNKASIKDNIREIIWDDNDNDIIFVVASKGIGKTVLLQEIYGATAFERNIIVADGRTIIGNAVAIKKSYVEGILIYLERHNVASRVEFCKSLKANINLSQKIEILILKRRKKLWDEIVPILCQLSIQTLKEIYVSIAGNTPLIVMSRDYFLSNEETEYFKNLHSDSLGEIGARVTHVIGIRPTPTNIENMNSIIEMVEKKVFVLPMLPEILQESDRRNPKSLATISVGSHGIINNSVDFQTYISSNSLYFDMYESIQMLFTDSNVPQNIFILANQEISAHNYEHLRSIMRKIYKPNIRVYEKRILLPYNGKLLWLDALSYYLALQMKIDDAIKETQKLFLLLMREICIDENDFCFGKPERNSFISFIKEASVNKENVFALGFSQYYADYAHLVNLIFKYKNYHNLDFDDLVNSFEVLDRITIDFTDENLDAMEQLHESTQCCAVLDMCFQMLLDYFEINRNNPQIKSIPESTVYSIRQFLNLALKEAYKWWDLTLIEEFVKFEKKLGETFGYIQVELPKTTEEEKKSSMNGNLIDALKKYNIYKGDIIMPKNAKVGILTILDEESDAVIEELMLQEDDGYEFGERLYYSGEICTENTTHTIVQTQALDQGENSVSNAYRDMVDKFKPEIIILVGIAGGLNDDVDYCSVVLSRDIISYDLNKDTPTGVQRRGRVNPTPSIIVPLYQRLQRAVKVSPLPAYKGSPDAIISIVESNIASGNAVIANPLSEIREWIRTFNDKTAACEMEAYGVSSTFYEGQLSKNKTTHAFCVIRGISDMADTNKNKKPEYRKAAAHNAAIVMKALIQVLP